MGNLKKLLIVQPHSDDALFSCSYPLLTDGYKVQVLTVENNPKRINEDTALYEFLGVKFHHLNIDFDDESYYGFFKQYKDVNHENAMSYLEEYFGKPKLAEIKTALLAFIKKFRVDFPDYKIIAPLGIAHPFHYFVHDVLVSKSDYFYREFPHSYKRRAQAQFQSAMLDYKLFKTVPTQEIHDIKFELAKKFYKSQSGLLWYEQGYIKKQLPEELYEKL